MCTYKDNNASEECTPGIIGGNIPSGTDSS